MLGRIYSVDDFNRTLPFVRSVVRDIQEGLRQLRAELAELGIPRDDQDLDSLEFLRELPWGLRDRIEEVRSWILELEELGIILKSAETGLVEAYGELDGEIVFFSWLPGEDEVRFWHDLRVSWRQRRPLPVAVS
jgi:hypothetical protein